MSKHDSIDSMIRMYGVPLYSMIRMYGVPLYSMIRLYGVQLYGILLGGLVVLSYMQLYYGR